LSKLFNYQNFISEHLTQFGALLQLESEYKKLLKEDTNNPELELICDKICKLLRLRNYEIDKGIVTVKDTVMLDSSSVSTSRLKKIETIPVKFGVIEGSFFCDRNALVSLEGCPKIVGKTFDCHENCLKTLLGCPEIIGTGGSGDNEWDQGDFNCAENFLSSLEGGPKSVIGFYSFSNNPIYELTGFCEGFDGEVFYHNTPVEEVLNLFGKTGDNLGRVIDLLNEWDVIRSNEIVLDRLIDVGYQFGLEIPDTIKFENYTLI
jgi:hypothetical protein